MTSNANGQEEKRHLREYERSDFSSFSLERGIEVFDVRVWIDPLRLDSVDGGCYGIN